MRSRNSHNAAFSLIELLIVISIMGILAASILPQTTASTHEQLDSMAHVLAADLAYARSLAVTNNSKYRVTLDVRNNRYTIRHSGTNMALDTLPHTPFRALDDPSDQQIVQLDLLPNLGVPVKIVGGATDQAAPVSITEIEFGPLGETTNAQGSIIWLSADAGRERRYISVRVQPVTGLTWIEKFQATAPPGVTSTATTPGS